MTQVESDASSLFGVPAGVVVPVPPAIFAGAGGQHLAYELHITNHSGVPMLLTRLAILDDTTTLAQWEGAALHAIVAQRRPDVTDSRDIPAGGWAIAHVWVTVDASARIPSTLRHVLTVDGRTLPGLVDVAGGHTIVLGPPLRGGDWLAANGPSNRSGHRRALVPIDGGTYIAQRFATDWARIGVDGRLWLRKGTLRACRLRFVRTRVRAAARVASYAVAERRAELGIRAALGATPGALLGLVLREVIALLLLGIGIGMPVALATGRRIEPLLFETTTLHVPTFPLVSLVLLTVAVVATAGPARRAGRTDPLAALRAE